MKKSIILVMAFLMCVKFGTYAQYTPEWVRTLTGVENEEIMQVCSDESGVYMSGAYQNDASLYGTSLTYLSAKDVVIAKFTHEGELIWHREILGDALEGVFDMVISEDNGLLITGWFTCFEVDFGDGWVIENSNQGSYPGGDSFIVKLNPLTGDIEWIKNYGSDAGTQNATRMAVDNEGNILVSGYYSADFEVDGVNIPFEQSTYNNDVYILKLDTDGNLIWNYTFGGNGFEAGKSIQCDSFGNVYIAAEYSDEFTLGEDLIEHQGDYYNTVVVKFDPDGNYTWSRFWGTLAAEIPFDIMITDLDEIFILAKMEIEPLDIYGNNLVSYGYQDALIVKMDVDGNIVWAKNFGGEYPDQAYALEQTEDGLIYLAGTYSSLEMHFDENVIPGCDPVKTGMFLVCMNADGVFQNYYSLFPNNEEGVVSGNYLTMYDDDAYISGFFSDEVVFGGQWSHNGGTHTDGYLYKLDVSTVSVNTVDENIKIEIFPNPVSSLLNIKADNNISNIRLVDANGKTVFVKNDIGTTLYQINTANLAPGFYYIKIDCIDGQHNHKIMVK